MIFPPISQLQRPRSLLTTTSPSTPSSRRRTPPPVQPQLPLLGSAACTTPRHLRLIRPPPPLARQTPAKPRHATTPPQPPTEPQRHPLQPRRPHPLLPWPCTTLEPAHLRLPAPSTACNLSYHPKDAFITSSAQLGRGSTSANAGKFHRQPCIHHLPLRPALPWQCRRWTLPPHRCTTVTPPPSLLHYLQARELPSSLLDEL